MSVVIQSTQTFSFYGFLCIEMNYIVDCFNVKLTICLWSLFDAFCNCIKHLWFILNHLTYLSTWPNQSTYQTQFFGSLACCFWIIIWHILYTSKLVIGYQMTWLFNSSFFTCKCSCPRASKRIFRHWTFLPYQHEETSIFGRFWSLHIFLTRLSETRVTYLVLPFPVVLGGKSNWWNLYISLHAWDCESLKDNRHGEEERSAWSKNWVAKLKESSTSFIPLFQTETYFLHEMSHSWNSSCLPECVTCTRNEVI